jgi:predicted SprT family Zn-dependent metalloprotease
LHEIAHALSFIRYGREGKGHGRLWKRVCREVGATPERVHKGILEYPDNHYKYIDDCACGITYKRHRKSDFRIYRCPKCKQPLFNRKEKIEWLASSALLKDILDGND